MYKNFRDFANNYDNGYLVKDENSKLYNYCSTAWTHGITSLQGQKDGAEKFCRFLIDHHENEKITEEFLTTAGIDFMKTVAKKN